MSQILRLLTLVLILAHGIQQPPRTVRGRYRKSGEGFSVVIREKAKGVLEGEAAVERGVRMVLPSGGNIYAYGEANSLEWRTPADGIRSMIEQPKCATEAIQDGTVGKLRGARTRMSCDEKVVRVVLAFRPGGGPIYWLRLKITSRHELEDARFLEEVATSFLVSCGTNQFAGTRGTPPSQRANRRNDTTA